MSRFRFMAPSSPSGLLRLADAAQVVGHLRRGGLAVLPTETGYLLGAMATSTPALRAAFAAKQRDPAHPMHVACASLSMAAQYADLSDAARLLLGVFTPGPLSVVATQQETLPHELVTWHGTVGIRIPDHPATLQIVAELGVPVTATSLNRSGEQSSADWSVLESLDWGDQDQVPVVDDPGSVRFDRPSTLVRVTGPEVEVLRAGPIGLDAIEQVLTAGGVAARAVGSR